MIKISDVVKDIKNSQLAMYHRGKSWEYCYTFFRNYKKFRNNENLLDSAALNLGFFLASWGMLRGSSFLLQKDYKFYIPIVKILVDSKYDKLWNFDFFEKTISKNIDSLFNLKEELKERIRENNRADGDDKEHRTDLIITKIIMATMGCVPSYDRYFKKGLKDIRMEKLGSFNEKQFRNLLDFSKKDGRIKSIYKIKCFIPETNIKHSPMKLLDLHFWLLGTDSNK